ncbi:unnamed protein product [Blepharisma stoltei]|uniref:FCP1 homology domain-containing protein n=1 Tax=Blepharisma stoltei TaxID=1481888 RepID=A0AAU9IDH2_9CILI|nr:unnamed protein product [Blepharisma stoltei]
MEISPNGNLAQNISLLTNISKYRDSDEEIATEANGKTPRAVFSTPTLHNAKNIMPEEDSQTMDTETDQEEQLQDAFDFLSRLPPMPSAPRNKVLPIKTRSTSRLTLVLDLDETLVHSEAKPISNPDAVINLIFNGVACNVYTLFRPGMYEFLHSVSKKFEVVVFTASHKAYASQLLRKIDPDRKLIKHRLYRDSCYNLKGNYIKDLRVLGRDLSEVIIIDNSIQAFGYQLDNGIPIVSWFDDPNDCELFNVHALLIHLLSVPDVRPILRQTFKLSRFSAQ